MHPAERQAVLTPLTEAAIFLVVTVGEGAYIGAGALVRERCRIGAWALVGMGAGVTGDVPGGEVWAGLPARRLRRVTVLPPGVGSAPNLHRSPQEAHA